ncbi:ABC transporter permease [Actinomadura darangshiensis]|uniref:ABC transporter permease n=1 Tax=Actinomadura darangshiensis TaxID=705336 RepID=UPI00244338ED|nr:ABC transporter permease [Actinomadura darangshiensis]
MTRSVRAVSSGASLLPVNLVLAVAMAVLLVVAVAVCHFGRLGHARAVLLAGFRAAVQLVAVSLVIGVVVEYVPLFALFVFLMYVVAVRTSGRRLTKGRTGGGRHFPSLRVSPPSWLSCSPRDCCRPRASV